MLPETHPRLPLAAQPVVPVAHRVSFRALVGRPLLLSPPPQAILVSPAGHELSGPRPRIGQVSVDPIETVGSCRVRQPLERLQDREVRVLDQVPLGICDVAVARVVAVGLGAD